MCQGIVLHVVLFSVIPENHGYPWLWRWLSLHRFHAHVHGYGPRDAIARSDAKWCEEVPIEANYALEGWAKG